MHKPGVPRPANASGASSSDKVEKGNGKKKMVVACMGCRKKKIKCTGDRPACSNCLRLQVECEYPIIKNRGSRFHYKDMMKKRVANLKRYFARNEPPPVGQEGSLDGEDNTVEGLLCMIKPSIPTINAIPSDERGELTKAWPPMDIVEHLVELYFKHVHGQTYSFLHRPTFLKRLKDGNVETGLVLALCGLTARYSTHPKVLNKQVPLYAAGEAYITQAKRVISEQVFHKTPTLETVQALICLIQNDYFRAQGGKTMIYIGMATQLAANLMIHLPRYPENATWIQREEQRRTFWSLMVLDRLAHSSPSWTVQFSTENFIDLPLPSSERAYYYELEVESPTLVQLGQDQQKDENVGLFGYHCQAVMLWSEVNIYSMSKKQEVPWENGSQYQKLKNKLDQFLSLLPGRYQYSKERLKELQALNHAGQFIHLHLELLLSRCVLNRSVCHHHRKDSTRPQWFFDMISSAAVTAANSISSLVADVLHADDPITLAPFSGFAIFTVSAVQVTNSFSSNAALADQARANLATNLRLLVELRDYWFAVGVWCGLLKDRYAQREAMLNSAAVEEDEADAGSPPQAYLPEDMMEKHPTAKITTELSKQHTPTAPPSPPFESTRTETAHNNGNEGAGGAAGDAWDVVQKRGEQEVKREWDNNLNTLPPVDSPGQIADLFLGLDGQQLLGDQFSTEWFADLQNLME